MLESFILNLKTQSAKVTDSLKSHSLSISENVVNLKAETSRLSGNLVTSLKTSTFVSNYLSLPQSDQDYDRELNQNKKATSPKEPKLRWPVLVNNQMKWVTLPPKVNISDDEEDIVERFIRVITIDEGDSSSKSRNLSSRRNDREEIRRRLAMGSDADEYYGGDRPGRKPSLQARLQSGMNLQICFMNETVSDTESPSSDTEPAASPVKSYMDKAVVPRGHVMAAKSPVMTPSSLKTRPSTSSLTLPLRREPEPLQPMTEADFFARQARLQAEARMALAQAKEMAHMQMEIERQRQKKSPITEMVRSSLEKVGIPFPDDRRRVSRQILTEMNLAQLQVIVNDLHTQIEVLNEGLVKFLMNRDDLHMEQDSMLVDIEDLTRYLGAKEQPMKEEKESPTLSQNNNLLPPSKPKLNRIAGMVKK